MAHKTVGGRPLNGRATLIAAFLEGAGWGDAEREPLGADWSQRRYERLRQGKRTAVLMDAGRDQPVSPFVAVAGWLRGIGLHAPDIYAADLENRLLLLEDLGNALVARAVGEGADERTLYMLATDVVLHFQRVPPPDFVPELDAHGLVRLLDLFLDFETVDAGEEERERFRSIWVRLLPDAQLAPAVFLYRDYHAENLLWLPHEEGLWRLGLLDFQDAFKGPPVYDLVSLIQDARRDVDQSVVEAVIQRFRDGRPDLGRQDIRLSIAILGAQRAFRILGVLGRLKHEEGRAMPAEIRGRVVRHLTRNLEHPALAPLRGWCERHAPSAFRLA